jgi:crossover junction endodeoxyribonuclease RusA
MNEIVFPWPPKELSPNARTHWARKARFTKAYRTECWALTRQAKAAIDFVGPIQVSLTFCPPDRRQRDLDNMLASVKAALDGMALALDVNDKLFSLSLRVADHVEGTRGLVKVRLARA